MASLQKKAEHRAARFLAQIIELRPAVQTAAQAAYLARCIELARACHQAIVETDAAAVPQAPAPARQAAQPPQQPAAAPAAPTAAAPQQASSAAFGGDDDDLPHDHPWRGQPDTPPEGWTPPAPEKRGRWTQASELQRGDPSTYIADNSDGTQF